MTALALNLPPKVVEICTRAFIRADLLRETPSISAQTVYEQVFQPAGITDVQQVLVYLQSLQRLLAKAAYLGWNITELSNYIDTSTKMNPANRDTIVNLWNTYRINIQDQVHNLNAWTPQYDSCTWNIQTETANSNTNSHQQQQTNDNSNDTGEPVVILEMKTSLPLSSTNSRINTVKMEINRTNLNTLINNIQQIRKEINNL